MKEQILKEIEDLKARYESDLDKNEKRQRADGETKKKRAEFLKQKFDSEMKGLEQKLKECEPEADETYSVLEAEQWKAEGKELVAIIRVDPLRKLYRFKKGKKK